MKASEFKKIIKESVREVIREELSGELKVIKEIKSKGLIPKDNKPKVPIKKKNNNVLYSKNPVLNDMLNELATEFDGSRWNKENQLSEGTEMVYQEEEQYEEDHDEPNIIRENKRPISIEGINPNVIPDPVKKALSRDYSALIKKLNDERGAIK